MKSAPPAVVSFLAAQQAGDSQMGFVDLFTLTLANGTVLRFSGADIPITYGGNTWLANGPIIEGLKYRATVGLDVDQQDITISINYAAATLPTVNGAPFMVALASGAFDLCQIQRDRAVFSAGVNGTLNGATLIGVITALYKGRFIEVKPGRLQAKITVANSLVVLQQNMPRRAFAPTCQHIFGDAFCTVNPTGSTVWSGTCGSGSTTTVINTAQSFGGQIGGIILFTSGALAGHSSTIVSAAPGVSVTVSPSFSAAPASLDAFTVTRANSAITSAGVGSTQQMLLTSAAQLLHAGGIVTFATGANAGVSATVARATGGSALWLQYPLPEAVAPGDAFTVSLGCDHTQATCVNLYNNLLNFFGFPQVPPAQTAQ